MDGPPGPDQATVEAVAPCKWHSYGSKPEQETQDSQITQHRYHCITN
jgi:hypothetical protein